jgi:phosphoglucosamine mutase
MALKYFGTDGVRGRAFEPPLTIEDAYRWGGAWASVAKENGVRTLVAGWDGRTSCAPFLRAFLAGFGNGAETVLLGVAPTPAVAWVTSRRPNAWGLVLSASHNPPEDNGIKGFDSKGAKLPEGIECALESAFDAMPDAPAIQGSDLDLAIQQEDMEGYLTHLGGMHFPDSFPVVVDCAHGATAPWAPRLFTGAVQWIGVPTDGERINVGVGSTHLGALRKHLLATNAAAGVAFDGDGDRCLMLDDKGETVDGDQMLWLLAKEMKQRGGEPLGVIGTVMSNGGLEQGLNELGIPFVRTPVGDKYLVRELDSTGWDMAAEASGHLIQRHVGPGGDGMATALAVLRLIIEKPTERRWDWHFEQWPMQMVNLKVRQRKDLAACPALQSAIDGAKRECGGSVRLVVRWSGTEPLLRLMAEAKEQWRVEQAMGRLVDAAKADMLT